MPACQAELKASEGIGSAGIEDEDGSFSSRSTGQPHSWAWEQLMSVRLSAGLKDLFNRQGDFHLGTYRVNKRGGTECLQSRKILLICLTKQEVIITTSVSCQMDQYQYHREDLAKIAVPWMACPQGPKYLPLPASTAARGMSPAASTAVRGMYVSSSGLLIEMFSPPADRKLSAFPLLLPTCVDDGSTKLCEHQQGWCMF